MTFQNMEISETECIAYAQQKYLTALRLGCDTSALAHLVKKPDGILVKLRYDKSICLMGGRKLIVRDNSVIGALGVSGAAEKTDAAMAGFPLKGFIVKRGIARCAPSVKGLPKPQRSGER